MSRFLLLLSIGLILFTVTGNVVLAQEPEPPPEPERSVDRCRVDFRGTRIETGHPGSGLPQGVRRTYQLDQNCQPQVVSETPEFADAAAFTAMDLPSGCDAYQAEIVHQDVIGIDLTRYDHAVEFCYTSGFLWYFNSWYHQWAQIDGWEAEWGYSDQDWLIYNWYAYSWGEGFFHWNWCSDGPCYWHAIGSNLYFLADGSASCEPYAYGDPVPFATWDVWCGYIW